MGGGKASDNNPGPPAEAAGRFFCALFTVSYIMGVAAIPAGFFRGQSIRREPGGIILSSPEGIRIKTKVDTQFLQNL